MPGMHRSTAKGEVGEGSFERGRAARDNQQRVDARVVEIGNVHYGFVRSSRRRSAHDVSAIVIAQFAPPITRRPRANRASSQRESSDSGNAMAK